MLFLNTIRLPQLALNCTWWHHQFSHNTQLSVSNCFLRQLCLTSCDCISYQLVTGHQFLPVTQSNLAQQEFCNCSHSKLFAWERDWLSETNSLVNKEFPVESAHCLSSPSKLLSLSSQTVMLSRNPMATNCCGAFLFLLRFPFVLPLHGCYFHEFFTN